MAEESIGFQFTLGPERRSRKGQAATARRNAGWTAASPSHRASGKPKYDLEIEHLELMKVLNFAIEDIYLARKIFPGARLQHPRLGPGTVLTCRTIRPYAFSFLPDAELDCDELGELQLKYYDPEELHSGWQFPERIGIEEWKPLQTNKDMDILSLTGEQRQILAGICAQMSTWQLGEAARFIIESLKERITK